VDAIGEGRRLPTSSLEAQRLLDKRPPWGSESLFAREYYTGEDSVHRMFRPQEEDAR